MFEIDKFYCSFPIEPIRTVWVRRNCLVQIFKTTVEQKLVLIYFATFSPLKIIPSFLLFQVQALLYQKPVKITLCVWVSALICHLIPLGTLVACALSRRTFILQRLHTHKRIRRKSPRVAHSECREIENPKKGVKIKIEQMMEQKTVCVYSDGTYVKYPQVFLICWIILHVVLFEIPADFPNHNLCKSAFW